MLKLFYITKDPAVARIAQAAGVDRIFVDMEYIGKAQRQGGMDTVQNHHTVEDVARLRPVLDQPGDHRRCGCDHAAYVAISRRGAAIYPLGGRSRQDAPAAGKSGSGGLP